MCMQACILQVRYERTHCEYADSDLPLAELDRQFKGCAAEYTQMLQKYINGGKKNIVLPRIDASGVADYTLAR